MATIPPSRTALRCLTAAILWLVTLALAPAAQAAPAFALSSTGQIVTFDTNTPGTLAGAVAITGLQAGETALGLDLRPATGQLYLLGSSSRVYVVNPVTGAATAVGGQFATLLSGASFGFDFNPTVDRIRIVSDSGQNLRINPDTGAIAAVDAALNPGTPHLVGSAYTNNVAGATTTTLYGIDSTTDSLVIQNPPNNGTLVPVGALGVDTNDFVGFDISANDGTAYATLTSVANVTSLYRLNLSTGAATLAGAMTGGPYTALTVLSRGVPMIGLTAGTSLIRFHSASPATINATIPVTGLQAGETLVGIDVRPADGQLYGVGSTSRLYLIDAITGAATAIGAPFSTLLSGTRFGVDFNPAVDRLRVVSDADQNLRINPLTGALVQADGALNPGTPTVTGAAYLNNVDGTTVTTLFDIDAATDQLLIQNPPNNGTLVPVGALGVDASIDVAFDISPLDNAGFAALTVGGVTGLYGINLTTGAATSIGAIGTGAQALDGLTAMPLVYQFAEGSTGTFFDTDLLLANPTTSAVTVTITYLTEAARVVTQTVQLAAQSRTTVSVDANTQIGGTAFSTTVASHLGIPIAVERTMRWDSTGYGMHTEKASPSLSRTWLFAEGAQGFFQTYFLLTNPTPAANSASVQFLLENGTSVTRNYALAPQSRMTIYTGDIAELVNRSFGTVVTFASAGAAERAMYFGLNPVFTGGHESAGVTRTSTDWFLAEGAANSFFTTFILVSNPNATPANVTMTYFRESGGTVTRTRTIAAATRVTINLAEEDASLANGSAATRVTSDAGIVVERAMYFPFTPTQWQEAHNAFGVYGTALRWGLAEGRVGGTANFQTFVLLANPGTTAANVTATFLRTTGAPVVKTFSVPAGARLTVTTGPSTMVPELANESFGVSVVSDQPIFAERALYSDANGIVFAAGSAATAAPLP